MSSTRCSDLHWCYLQQTVHFFQSDTHPVIRKKSPLLDLQSYFWSKGPRSDKPSHKHDSNKYQTKAFVICDHKSDQTRSVTHINKTYLVWLMYWLLFNQPYQHHTNQKLRSWAYAVFQNHGVCGQAFPFLPSPSPVIPCFLLPSQLSRWTHAETLAMQVMVTGNLRKLITLFVLGGNCVTMQYPESSGFSRLDAMLQTTVPKDS